MKKIYGLAAGILLVLVAILSAGKAPDGSEPQIDFPEEEWMKNIGSKLDGAGMCVFTSFEHSARWAGWEEFRGFRDWCAANYKGGGTPSKLAQLVKAYVDKKGIKDFDVNRNLIQYEGKDFDFLRQALQNNWLPCVTLYHSPRYGNQVIFHMVNCAHYGNGWCAILDNNFKPYEWFPEGEIGKRIAWHNPPAKQNSLKDRYWAAVIMKDSPPPAPTWGGK